MLIFFGSCKKRSIMTGLYNCLLAVFYLFEAITFTWWQNIYQAYDSSKFLCALILSLSLIVFREKPSCPTQFLLWGLGKIGLKNFQLPFFVKKILVPIFFSKMSSFPWLFKKRYSSPSIRVPRILIRPFGTRLQKRMVNSGGQITRKKLTKI